jgi:hypothetical protein
MPEATEQKPAPRVNLRTPDVMAAVQAQVETHYRSEIVEHLRAAGGVLSVDGLTVRLAKAVRLLLRSRARHRPGVRRRQGFQGSTALHSRRDHSQPRGKPTNRGTRHQEYPASRPGT